MGPKGGEHQSGSAGGTVPLHPGGAGDSWGRRKPGRGRRGRPRRTPRAGRARLGVGRRAGRGRGVPRPSPSVPAALGRMTQQPKQRQRQEEAVGGRRGGEGSGGEGQTGSGGGWWEGRTGGRRSRAPPHPTSLTSDRPGRCPTSGGLSAAEADARSDQEEEGIPAAPSSEGRPTLGARRNPPSRQPASGLGPAPCHIR